MCGIVGCVMKANSGFYQRQEDTFFELLFADQLRGEDSTGLIGIEKDTTFYIAKEACKASEFIPKYKGTPTSTAMWNQGKAYIGHNRKKTIGDIKDENAHPFVVEDTFAMVHNGTLDSGWHKLADGQKVDIDSEALAIHFHAALKKAMEGGDQDTEKIFEEALGQVHGAYAVAMYDQTRHKIFLTRNKDRPLSIIETDDAWFFMSESLMGAWILSRLGRGGITRYDYSKLKVSGIQEHEVITFDLDKNTMGRTQLHPKPKYATSYQSTTSSPPPTPSGGTTALAEIKKGVSCSEKDYKRFRKEWLGKRITVVVNDLLEENYPSERLEWGNADKLILYANSTAIWWMHSITLNIKCSDFGIKSMDEILGKKWVVDIESAGLTSHGCIIIEGGDPKPVVTSPLKLVGSETNKEFRSQLSKLDYEELHELAEEVKYNGQTWQINALNSEIVWRDSINTMEEAAKRAAQRSVVLQQVKRKGKFIYQDAEGNIYYERPVEVQ
jgi:predicted glutamine amidotransferase